MGRPPRARARGRAAWRRAGAAGAWLATGARAAPDATVEVLYKVNCTDCRRFLSEAVVPLLRAGLPGRRVRLSVLPLVPPPEGRAGCLADPPCAAALPGLCALRGALPGPAPADREGLAAAVEFAACSLALPGAGGVARGAVGRCAREAGLEAAEIHACVAGGEALDILFSDSYIHPVMSDMHWMRASGFPDRIDMPWVRLNGELLDCAGGGCSGTRAPQGTRPLERPGGLLFLVCSALDDPPAACDGLEGGRPGPRAADVGSCEDCAEALGGGAPPGRAAAARRALGRRAARAARAALVAASAAAAALAWRQLSAAGGACRRGRAPDAESLALLPAPL